MMHTTQILGHHIHYILPNQQVLFKELNFSFAPKKIGLVGRNGIGKTTLLKIINHDIQPSSGSLQTQGRISYLPQNDSLPDNKTISEVLGFVEKINAFEAIAQGSIEEKYFVTLNDDWQVKERLQQQLMLFGLGHLSPEQMIGELSAGQSARLMLTRVFSSDADFVLLDEPTNHLDQKTRKLLYAVIRNWQGGLLVVSHDRTLLNLMDEIAELTSLGLSLFGGNYDFYLREKTILKTAQEQELFNAKKSLEKSKSSVQSSREKLEKRATYGRKLPNQEVSIN